MILFALAPLALAAAVVPTAPQGTTGPSFACSAATSAMEKTICGDPKLGALDREMAQLYSLAKTSASGTGPSNQLAAQRMALQAMRACTPPLRACLEDRYVARTQALAIAVLTTAPATALPVLRRNDPAFAPILEAVQLWSEAPADAAWSAPERAQSRRRITTLLRPYLTRLLTDADQSYGRSILQDAGADGVSVKTIDDIFRSDRHFAALLQILGPYLDQATPTDLPRDLPCAAIVRHPALLSATGPVFGSTMDNFVFGNDCQATLPPLPLLEALQTKLYRGWPQCEGTIRFAIYRGFATDIDQARLGRTPSAKAKALPARKGVTRASVTGVERELTDYYSRFLGRTPAAAATMARSALSELMTDAHQCE
ncbi:hypothetical protein [uncultured Sphingomonas sp.]|uniref:lysozyme inhibitor LprI family protein n=1 Tax=uncultured Sphingomonas sp. TaxID=158754 RepID=UPI002601096A|nr:hypothetical protein [uncultured Sphingomonas sp.]